MTNAAAQRPRRKPRADGERSRRTILDAAARLATTEGLEGLSIGRLADEIGMSKSGLYAHFRSKEQLQLETIDTALEIFNHEVVEPTKTIEDPRERLLALYDHFFDHIERRVFPGGCFFASVEAEFDTHPGPVHDRIAIIQRGWARGIEQLIQAAQAAGTVSADEDPAQLAFELDSYGLMGNTAFVLHNDAAYLDRARKAISRRLAGG
jgi:AcrR family transcriptional regulator